VFLFLVLDEIKRGRRRIAQTPARNFRSLAASQVREWEWKKRRRRGIRGTILEAVLAL
jgi:hypothetical protein